MGKTILERGLRPVPDDGPGPSATLQLEWMWTMVAYHAHRFRGRPIAEVLASWTNILLIHQGLNPTIADIARASGLPRPTVSRYVAKTIEHGWAEERVSPSNRRRRELHLTDAGRKELEAIVDFFHGIFGELTKSHPDNDMAPMDYLVRLEKLSASIAERLDTSLEEDPG